MKTTNEFRGVNDLAARSLLAFNELCDNGKVDDESISKVAAEYRNEVESLSRKEQEALTKEMIDRFFDGLKRKEDMRRRMARRFPIAPSGTTSWHGADWRRPLRSM